MSLVVDALKKLNTEKQMASDVNGLPPITNYIDDNIDDESFSFNKSKIIIVSLIIGIIISVIVFITYFLPMIKYGNIQANKATIVDSPVATQSNTQNNKQSNAPIITDKPISSVSNSNNSNLSSNNVKQVSNSNATATSPVSDFFPVEDNNKQLEQPIVKQKENNNEIMQKTESKSVYIDPIQALLPPTVVKKEEEPIVKINNNQQKVNVLLNNKQEVNQNIQPKNINTQSNIVPAQNNYDNYIKNAITSFNNKDYKMSLSNYLQAYSIKKDQAVAENITTLYVLTDEPTKAIKFVKENNIKNPQFVGNVIMNLVDKSYRYEANQLITFSRNFQDNGDLAFAEGYYHIKNQNFQKAEIAFNRARNLNPSSPVYSYTYATVIESDGKHKEALEIYRNVLNLNPDEELTQRTKARINALEKLYK